MKIQLKVPEVSLRIGPIILQNGIVRISPIQTVAVVFHSRAEGIAKHIILSLPKIIRNWLKKQLDKEFG